MNLIVNVDSNWAIGYQRKTFSEHTGGYEILPF